MIWKKEFYPISWENAGMKRDLKWKNYAGKTQTGRPRKSGWDK
jgi:hypothetical protein